MRKFLFCGSLVALLVICLSLHATLIELKVKYWVPDFSADVRVDDEGVGGTTVDIDEDLGVDTDENIFPVELVLHLGDQFRIWFAYTTLSLDGSAIVNEDIVFAGETFNINAQIDSHVELLAVEAGIEYDLFSSEIFALGPCIGAIYFDGSAEIEDRISLISAEGTLSTVVPAIGAFARVSIIEEKFEVGVRLTGFVLDDDTFIDGVVEAKYNLLKNFGIVAGYHDRSVEVEEDDIFVDASLAGFFVGGVLSF